MDPLLKLLPVRFTKTRCPAVASKISIAIPPVVPIVTCCDGPPIVILAVCTTLAAVYPVGGTYRSGPVAVPYGVATLIRPDPADAGTVHVKLVAVAALIAARVGPIASVLLADVVLKFVPVTVSWVPGTAMLALAEVIAGALAEATVNDEALVAEPPGALTDTVPEVAPAGTVTTSSNVYAAVIVAVVPLKVTVSWLAVALNPVPYIRTIAPAGALPGASWVTDTVEEDCWLMPSRFPAGSH
jgi:hypothetical protein